jgi:hypothetical protein
MPRPRAAQRPRLRTSSRSQSVYFFTVSVCHPGNEAAPWLQPTQTPARAEVPRMTPSAGGSVVLDFEDPETLNVRSMVPSGTTTNYSIRIRKLSAACSQRCSQRVLVLKMTTLQAAGLPLRVSHEGLELPTPVRHLVDRQGITQIIYLIAALGAICLLTQSAT